MQHGFALKVGLQYQFKDQHDHECSLAVLYPSALRQGSRFKSRKGHLAWFRRERLPWPEGSRRGGLDVTTDSLPFPRSVHALHDGSGFALTVDRQLAKPQISLHTLHHILQMKLILVALGPRYAYI